MGPFRHSRDLTMAPSAGGLDRSEPVSPRPSSVLAPIYPTVAPRMLFPRLRSREMAFPFDQPGVTYYYLARNAIFALAWLWKLSGHEVLFPAYFHGVELDPLLAAGIRPSFFPVDGQMQVRCEEVLSRISPRTRAVYLTHYLGFPGPVREIAEACRERGIPLIEDCALAFLSRLGDRPLGSFGDAAVFCLYKTLPVADGGVLVLREPSPTPSPPARPPLRAPLMATASSLALHFQLNGNRAAQLTMAALRTLGRGIVRRVSPEHIGVGSQLFELRHAHFAMSPLSRLVLAGQHLSTIVEHRRRNFLILLDRLRSISSPVFDRLPEGVCPLFYPLRVRDKRAVMERLSSRGIESVNLWSLSHPAMPEGTFPEVDQLRRTIVEVPCHQDLSPETMGAIADAVYQCRDWL